MAGEFDFTKGDMNLAANDAGRMTASETLFDAAHREVSQQTAMDKTAIGDGGVRGLTAADARVGTDIENANFAATLIAMSQKQVEARIASLQEAA